MRPLVLPGRQPSHFPHRTAPRSDPPPIRQRGCRDSCRKSCREASTQVHIVCLGVKTGPCCVPFSLLDYVSLKTDTCGEGPSAIQAKCWIQKEKGSLFTPTDGPQHVGEANCPPSATKGQEGSCSQLISTTFTSLGVSARRAVTV